MLRSRNTRRISKTQRGRNEKVRKEETQHPLSLDRTYRSASHGAGAAHAQGHLHVPILIPLVQRYQLRTKLMRNAKRKMKQ
jgi:hypothetical protein